MTTLTNVNISTDDKPSREEAEAAVHTLLRWAGDDPNREGLRDTPKRVARAYEEWFAGYDDDPVEYLQRTFEEVEGYDEIVVDELMQDIAGDGYRMQTLISAVVTSYPFTHRRIHEEKTPHEQEPSN